MGWVLHVAGMHLACTWHAPGMCLACTWHAPGMCPVDLSWWWRHLEPGPVTSGLGPICPEASGLGLDRSKASQRLLEASRLGPDCLEASQRLIEASGLGPDFPEAYRLGPDCPDILGKDS